MREEDGVARYMSPLVKQDLAKLEKDGESRRVALHALKQFVENLEPSSVPRFLAQVSESKDTGGSRSYAISLYEEVARVHKKLIVPQIGRVMATVTRSLSASGSSPQLHQACAKVAAALVRYSIEIDSSTEEAEDILKEVSRPLVDLLAGKLEPVAAGAATCMQALVESEKWKHAPSDLVSEVCHRTTTALGDKSTRTVAHMQLARSLATINPGTLNVFGACLLHAGEEVLGASSYSWQHRKCAAKMVQAVLAIVDRETLALECDSITQVLENCRHDRMPHVRTAVCEALQTAKMLTTGETIRELDDGDHQLAVPQCFEPSKGTPHRRTWSSNKYSPISQDSHSFSSFSPPAATTDSGTSPQDPYSTPLIGSIGRMKRSPLFPSKNDIHSDFSAVPAPAAGSTLGLTSKEDANINGFCAKENEPSSVGGGNMLVARQDMSGLVDGSGHIVNMDRSCVASPGSQISSPSLLHKLDGTTDIHRSEKESLDFTPTNVTQDRPKGKIESRFSPFEAQITRSFGEAVGDLMAENEDILSGGSAELEGRVCGKNGMDSRGTSRLPKASEQFRRDSQTPESMEDSEYVQSNSLSYPSVGSSHSDANDAALLGKRGGGRNSAIVKSVNEVEDIKMSQTGAGQGLPAGNLHGSDLNACISHAQYMQLANLSTNPEDGYSALKPRLLITTADFLPYTTPRRLVLSLQSHLSSPDSKSNEVDKEDSVRPIDDEADKVAECTEDADMDVDSSSDSGWSVMDNPIASDASLADDSEEVEERQFEVHESLPLPQNVLTGTLSSPSKPAVSSWMPPMENSSGRGTQAGHLKHLGNVEVGRHKGNASGTSPQTSSPLETLAESPNANLVCSSCTESQRRRSAMKAEEWDLDLDMKRVADDQRTGARRSMMFEQESKSLNDRSHESELCRNEPVNVVGGTKGSSGWWSNSLLVRSARSSCTRMTSFAEAILGGSLCFVIAVPISMVIARALQNPADPFLVPT